MKKINFKDNGLYIIIGLVVFIIVILFVILIVKLTTNETRKLIEDFDGDYNTQVNKIIKTFDNESCDGAIHFKSITEYDKKYTSSELDNEALTRYVLSYLENERQLKDAKPSTIQSMAKNLFYKPKKLEIKNIEYKKEIYNEKKSELVKENATCNKDIKYVSSILGYTNDENHIVIDMNIGYVKDGDLYSLENIKLNKYDKEANLQLLFTVNSYYVITYTLDDNIFKLDTVELKQKF